MELGVYVIWCTHFSSARIVHVLFVLTAFGEALGLSAECLFTTPVVIVSRPLHHPNLWRFLKCLVPDLALNQYFPIFPALDGKWSKSDQTASVLTRNVNMFSNHF